jgi:hypothetical protein
VRHAAVRQYESRLFLVRTKKKKKAVRTKSSYVSRGVVLSSGDGMVRAFGL